MTHFQKLKTQSILKWVSSVFAEKHLKLLKPPNFHNIRTIHTAKIPFHYSDRALHTANATVTEAGPAPGPQTMTKITRAIRTRAQAALLDYLHCTRGYQFTDAENMSKNSPNFLHKLLGRVDNLQEVEQSLTRFFRYHPINEFEPFLESLGLDPSEVPSFLPRDLMFLIDDSLLLENFHELCNYGIPCNKIGKIYKEAAEIFGYECRLLGLKIRAYEELGLSKSNVIHLVASSPSLLIGGVNRDFVKVLEELEGLGIENNWICGCLSEKNSYNWSKILIVLRFFTEMGQNQEELRSLFVKNPEFLLEGSGKNSFLLIAVILKLGIKMNEIMSLFSKLPRVQSGSSIRNLRQSLLFFLYSEMEVEEIVKIMHTHLHVLGSCSLKSPKSVLSNLNIGKKRLCGIIKEDPNQLRNWVLGSKVTPLPSSGEDQRSLTERTAFLVNLGFVENSNEMKKALKVFRGKGDELQERFDCLVKVGLNRNDVSRMIKTAPQVLNQSRSVIEKKIDFLVNGLGYPLESLVAFPAYMAYTMERVKLRFSMYNWLKDEGMARPMLALSTILACSDKIFVRQFVSLHPEGPEVWKRFQTELSSY
ncbi:transcription termination factor MTEF18, mitochondrial-like isoform X2 [Magnolia sinica]|uniref:transcription termination factor MTEF18, mitochondrial-like isoform X2 n=1 Tax=Magnolia sinica TaxID=86752 RepID=UPI002657D194|nr:transcription termination factor MTEF18, mitochondrial-like isoform X2 [Magnolia sinica]